MPRYCLADFAACSFQFAPQLSAPYLASESEYPSYFNCSIRPVYEKAVTLRYIAAKTQNVKSEDGVCCICISKQ